MRMDRLTFEGNFCDIALCGHVKCPYNTACSQKQVWERLKAYEDTGLSPIACEESAKIEKGLSEGGYSTSRMVELMCADQKGRVIVLPCKVGHRVFALLDTDKHISECEVKQIGLGNEIGFVGLEPIGDRGREYGVSLKGFGKTVFLTREEAEKALAEMEGKKDV